MNPFVDFSPGPSQLYFTVANHIKKALDDHIISLSHREKPFEKIYRTAVNNVHELLEIPDSFHIFFVGSATEIWERMIQNLVEKTSLHLVNGAFSEKFYKAALQMKKESKKIHVCEGDGFKTIPLSSAELIAITHNESSTGVMLPNTFIADLRKQHPQSLIALDAVSSLPYAEIDYTNLDSVYFSVQKGFGLPPGLGVWIVNDRCVDKAENLLRRGISIGTYHTLPSLLNYGKKNQSPETPNILGIYLLGKVAEDMLKKEITSIRKETEYKAAVIYQALHAHKKLNIFVKKKEFRSKTIIVAQSEEYTESALKFLSSKGIRVGHGYGKNRDKHLRFGNFPTHSKEYVDYLADCLQSF